MLKLNRYILFSQLILFNKCVNEAFCYPIHEMLPLYDALNQAKDAVPFRRSPSIKAKPTRRLKV
jgi:hypothetical protein